MKKAMGLLTGLFVFAAVNAWALSIDTVTVTGTNSASGAVTVSATVNGIVSGAMVTYQVTSADGLARRYFYPTDVVGTSWSSSDWTPYFTGTFTIELTAFDYAGGMPVTASTTVTVTRDIYGTVNGIKYSTAPYDANGTWNNIDTGAVKLHDIGMINDGSGMSSIGCNLLNASPTISQYMTEEERDVAYTDTVGYKPAGTPYRFDVTLHARPRGFMGMGEIKRWIWSPYDTNSPDGRGVLVVDMLSCSPWRSSYSNALQSHVGFAPLLLLFSIGLLVLVFIPGLGVEMGGSSRWLRLPLGFYLQPSEFIKLGIIFLLARLLRHERHEHPFQELLLTVVLAGLPLILILRQPDLGTALILLMVGTVIFFMAGVKLWKLTSLFGSQKPPKK